MQPRVSAPKQGSSAALMESMASGPIAKSHMIRKDINELLQDYNDEVRHWFVAHAESDWAMKVLQQRIHDILALFDQYLKDTEEQERRQQELRAPNDAMVIIKKHRATMKALDKAIFQLRIRVKVLEEDLPAHIRPSLESLIIKLKDTIKREFLVNQMALEAKKAVHPGRQSVIPGQRAMGPVELAMFRVNEYLKRRSTETVIGFASLFCYSANDFHERRNNWISILQLITRGHDKLQILNAIDLAIEQFGKGKRHDYADMLKNLKSELVNIEGNPFDSVSIQNQASYELALYSSQKAFANAMIVKMNAGSSISKEKRYSNIVNVGDTYFDYIRLFDKKKPRVFHDPETLYRLEDRNTAPCL